MFLQCIFFRKMVIKPLLMSLGIDMLQGGMDTKSDIAVYFFADRLMKTVYSFAKKAQRNVHEPSISVCSASIPFTCFLHLSLSEAWDSISAKSFCNMVLAQPLTNRGEKKRFHTSNDLHINMKKQYKVWKLLKYLLPLKFGCYLLQLHSKMNS